MHSKKPALSGARKGLQERSKATRRELPNCRLNLLATPRGGVPKILIARCVRGTMKVDAKEKCGLRVATLEHAPALLEVKSDGWTGKLFVF